MLTKINHQLCLHIGNNNGPITKLYNVAVEILRDDNENIWPIHPSSYRDFLQKCFVSKTPKGFMH